MNWDLQECQMCHAQKKTLYAFKEKRHVKMCKTCYNKELKKRA